MNTQYTSLIALLAAAALAADSALAQTVVQQTSTTTSLGTISEFSPETIVVRTENATEPLRYRYTKTTTYVDEAGQPVSIETVKSGLPVTVHYTKVGNDLVASRVIVRKVAAAPAVTAPVVEKRTTTTTTTTEKK